MSDHDPIICLQRLRAHVRQRLGEAGWFDGEDDPELQLAYVCYFVAKAATDPDGFSLVTFEVSASDAQLQRLQVAPLSRFSRADRLECLQGCFAFAAETFPDEVAYLRTHLNPDETPPLAAVPRWVMDTFVRWPSGGRGEARA